MPTTLTSRLHHYLTIGLLLCLPEHAAALGWKELAVVRSRSKGPDLFAIDSDDSVKHSAQTAASGSWSGPEALDGIAQDITAVALSANRFEVFVIGSDGSAWRNAQKPNGKWGGWQSMEHEAKRLVAGKTKAGRFELFAVGADDAVWHCGRKGPNGRWSSWQSLGGGAKQLAVTEGSGGFEVFIVGLDDVVWRKTPTTDWESLGGVAKDIAVSRLPNGGIDLFVIGSDDAVYHKQRDTRDAGWSDWENWGSLSTRLSIAEAKPGVAELFVLGSDDAVWHRIRSAPGAPWSDWQRIDRLAPLDVTFAGEATMSIPELNVSESKAVSLGIRFSVDRRQIEITSFPPIETKRFDTPMGKSRSTVSLASGSTGTFDSSSGRVAVPLTLKFDQSLDVPLVEEDADVALDLRTDAEGGSALDWASGHIVLAADGKFKGRGGVNPLRNKACHVVISGVLDPLPERNGSAK
jgi:hypothetical protein